jgi:hypothetical protein
VARQVAEQVAREQRRRRRRWLDEVADAVALVHAVPPSSGGGHVLAERLATTPGPVRNMLDASVITTQSVSAGE